MIPVPLFSSLWQFATNATMADPGSRHWRWVATHDQIAISTIDDDGIDRHADLAALAVGDQVAVRSTKTSGDWGLATITTIVDLVTWFRIDLTVTDIGSNVSDPSGNDLVLFDFWPADTAGVVPITAEDVFAWMGTPAPTPAALDSMAKVVDAVLINASRTHTAPTDGDDDWNLGLTMQSARYWRRKSSPEGVIANSEFGAIRVTRFDADIETMLGPFIKFEMA